MELCGWLKTVSKPGPTGSKEFDVISSKPGQPKIPFPTHSSSAGVENVSRKNCYSKFKFSFCKKARKVRTRKLPPTVEGRRFLTSRVIRNKEPIYRIYTPYSNKHAKGNSQSTSSTAASKELAGDTCAVQSLYHHELSFR